MPFTPFHFGPSACLSLPAKRYIDFPVFVLANVAIDVEPLTVMVFNLPYRLHGMAHTFLGAAIVGICLGVLANFFRGYITAIMNKILHLEYSPSLLKFVVSAILGAWFHVLLDSPLYIDIRPFYPFSKINPLQGYIETGTMYKACALAFIPAIALYIVRVIMENKKERQRKPGQIRKESLPQRRLVIRHKKHSPDGKKRGGADAAGADLPGDRTLYAVSFALRQPPCLRPILYWVAGK